MFLIVLPRYYAVAADGFTRLFWHTVCFSPYSSILISHKQVELLVKYLGFGMLGPSFISYDRICDGGRNPRMFLGVQIARAKAN